MCVNRILNWETQICSWPDISLWLPAVCCFLQSVTNKYWRKYSYWYRGIQLFNPHCPALFRAQILLQSLVFLHWNHLSLRHCVLPPPPHSAANLSPNNPKGKSGKSQFMGHVSRSLVLSGANKPLSARRLASLLSTTSKLEIDFCLELKGLRPFHCLSSVCMCVCTYTCLCMQPYVHAFEWMSWVLCVYVRVCRCYLCNWI